MRNVIFKLAILGIIIICAIMVGVNMASLYPSKSYEPTDFRFKMNLFIAIGNAVLLAFRKDKA